MSIRNSQKTTPFLLGVVLTMIYRDRTDRKPKRYPTSYGRIGQIPPHPRPMQALQIRLSDWLATKINDLIWGPPPVRKGPTNDHTRSGSIFNNPVFDLEQDAIETLDRIMDLFNKFKVVTLSDFYDILGVPSTHEDDKFGWTDLHRADVAPVSLTGGGYRVRMGSAPIALG